jgi:hypothetical protein
MTLLDVDAIHFDGIGPFDCAGYFGVDGTSGLSAAGSGAVGTGFEGSGCFGIPGGVELVGFPVDVEHERGRRAGGITRFALVLAVARGVDEASAPVFRKGKTGRHGDRRAKQVKFSHVALRCRPNATGTRDTLSLMFLCRQLSRLGRLC